MTSFNIDSKRRIESMPEYKPSTDISFLAELLSKKELTREERLQLFTAQSLDRIVFNLDYLSAVAMHSHNELVEVLEDLTKLKERVKALEDDVTPADKKVKTWFRENLGLLSIVKGVIIAILSAALGIYLTNKYGK